MKNILLFTTLLFQTTLLKAQISPATNIIAIDVNQPQTSSYIYDSAFTNF